MTYEFEGRSEKEAIERAAEELGLASDDFDVEILENQKSGIFKKGLVRIRVHIDDGMDEKPQVNIPKKTAPALQATEFEAEIISFIRTVIEKMGYSGEVSVQFREERKLGIKIDSGDSSILIGKKGKNLDALQFLVNIYAGRLGNDDIRIILDSEGYRLRHEENLVRMAYTVADRVRESKQSILLEPMNPYDRRLIHTTLNDINDIETESEGEGLFKQVRVYYRGAK
ncbi:MAG: protein jag [Spirochaetaceae bacterium]|jgi:spoIIIJ-associated protein|nr:protein jag [Spirochaetaceae bacterium]